MKKILLLTLSLLSLTACENMKVAGGNQMLEGSRTFNYAYVKSSITGDKYYHISGWKEYGPEGGVSSEYGSIAPYVGLEIQLAVSGDVVYYYEPGLMYVLSKEYNVNWGKALGVIE